MNLRSLRKKTIGSLLALALLVPSGAYAYQYWGNSSGYFKFTSGINSGIYQNLSSDNVVISGVTYNWKTAWHGAMNEWNNLTDTNIKNSEFNTGTVKIQTYDGSYGMNGVYGWVEHYSGSTAISSHWTAPSSSWNTAKAYLNRTLLSSHSLTYSQYRGVAVHEIGHALGLSHESGSTRSVMNVDNSNHFLTKSWLTPQTDDINGVNNLY